MSYKVNYPLAKKVLKEKYPHIKGDKDIAELLECSHRTIDNIRTNNVSPGVERLMKLHKLTGLSVNELLINENKNDDNENTNPYTPRPL